MFIRIERSTSAEATPAPPVEVVELISPRTNAAGYTPAEHLFAALCRQSGISLEIGGDTTARRFYVRLTGVGAREFLNAHLSAAYPQTRARTVSVDPARRQAGEQVAASRSSYAAPSTCP
jgi:hypothetical protein